MVNTVNSHDAGAIQSYTKFTASNKLSDGICLQAVTHDTQTTGHVAQYDKLELSQEQRPATLNVPDEISIDIPRAWTIMGETFECWNQHLQSSLEKADSMNLSFGERLTFLKEDGKKWVDGIRQNDPEMFVAWLKINKDSIEQGKADLVGLPSDFTMQDYFAYVKEPFSALG